MSDNTYENLPLVARHVPDYSVDDTGYGQKERKELPGHLHIGTIIEGVFKPLAKIGYAGLMADIERAKQNQPEQAAEPEVEPQQTGTGTVEQPQQ